MASRSVRIDGAGLDKVRQRMAELEKPLNPDKRGWSQEDLERQAYVSISTVKRFLKGNPVDRNYAISILKALGFEPIIAFKSLLIAAISHFGILSSAITVFDVKSLTKIPSSVEINN